MKTLSILVTEVSGERCVLVHLHFEEAPLLQLMQSEN